MNTYVLENWGHFLAVESQVEPRSSSWELEVQPQGLGFVRTGVGLNAALLHGYSSLGSRRRQMVLQVLCMKLFHQVECKLKEGCSVSHSRALTGEVLSVLVTGAGSCGIYTVAQDGIFFSLQVNTEVRVQFLKPGCVIEKVCTKKTPTCFSSTAAERKSATVKGKADRKTTTAKARNLTENMKFENCCISDVFPQSLLSSWLSCTKQGAGHSWKLSKRLQFMESPTTKQQLLGN